MADSGKVERAVKMDYSVTYRENDKLDLHLGEQITNIRRSARRAATEKDEELESARADAEKTLRLKEAAKSRQNEGPSLAILCQSVAAFRRTRSDSSFSVRRRSSSALSNGFARSVSVVSRVGDIVEEEQVDGPSEMNSAVDYPMLQNGQPQEVRRLTVTERRLAKERDQYSAKNIFNVRRRNYSSSYVIDTSAKYTDNAPDSSRTATPTTSQPKPTTSKRPMTSPAAYNRGPRTQNNRGYLRPTTAFSSRSTRHADEGDGYGRSPRRPRSRRELQQLSELKIDPFRDEISERPVSWSPTGDRHQDLLQSLHADRSQLQARVSAFLKTMEDFNKRGNKSGLDQILEAS